MLRSEDCLICEETLAKCIEDAVELRCKLQEKLHRVTWPLGFKGIKSQIKCALFYKRSFCLILFYNEVSVLFLF